MAVGIQHEGSVVAPVIARPQPRRAVIAAAIFEGRAIEFPDRFAIPRTEADVRTLGRGNGLFDSDRELDAWRTRSVAVVRSAAFEIDSADQPEQPQRRI